MYSVLPLLGLFALPSVLGHVVARSASLRCGTPGPSEAYIASMDRIQAQKEAFRASGNATRVLADTLAVDLYIHIVAGSESHDDGYITQAEVDDQVAVLQSTYAPTGISFNLRGADWHVSPGWVNEPGTASEEAMKRALHAGDYRTVNLYVMKNLTAYGRCTIPMEHADDPQPDRLLLDGCIVRPETLPGGSLPHIDEGKTATHEIGHWFGLWHTFEPHGRVPPNPPSGCVGLGDEVDDTPAERFESTTCPEGRDTCADQPGLDPIHNYMDYSYDSCLTEFTPGQTERMFMIYQNYRANA